jgi:superfamily I DNA and/or RNA helicase
MEFRFKKKGWNDILSVLTIDQCQGQQADIVILSLVRKPTRFLDKNRLNVALSRACQKMYFLCDKNLFVEASQNQAWECHLLAKDLLDLAGN